MIDLLDQGAFLDAQTLQVSVVVVLYNAPLQSIVYSTVTLDFSPTLGIQARPCNQKQAHMESVDNCVACELN